MANAVLDLGSFSDQFLTQFSLLQASRAVFHACMVFYQNLKGLPLSAMEKLIGPIPKNKGLFHPVFLMLKEVSSENASTNTIRAIVKSYQGMLRIQFIS